MISNTVGDEQLPFSATVSRDAAMSSAVRSSVEDARAARMPGPGYDVATS